LIKKLALLSTSALLLTGCTGLSLPDQADAPACEAMSAVLSSRIETLPSGGFDAVALSNSITSDVLSVAPEGFQANIQRVTDALASDPISATDGSRIWYFVDGQSVFIERIFTAHPNETK
jgi:hypothetical protein